MPAEDGPQSVGRASVEKAVTRIMRQADEEVRRGPDWMYELRGFVIDAIVDLLGEHDIHVDPEAR